MHLQGVIVRLIGIAIAASFLSFQAIADDSKIPKTAPVVVEEAENTQADFIPYQDKNGLVLRLSSEENAPFLFNGRFLHETGHEGRYASSINVFTHVSDCLKSSERDVSEPNLDAIDWAKMTSLEDAEVCIWRITSSYGNDDIGAIRSWLSEQGFRVLDTLTFSNKGGTRVIVSATWPLKKRGMLVSQGRIFDWWTKSISHSLGLSVDFGTESELIAVKLNYSTK